jgi:hemolysin activation/secretion protein/AraC-like DNA-binding protein
MGCVAEGAGYWLQENAARELNPGDCFAVAFNGRGLLRASQVGPLKLQYYGVDPRSIADLLTVTEGQQLDAALSSPSSSVLTYPASDGIAQEFARVTDQTRACSLLQRCRLLQLWAGAVSVLLADKGPASAPPGELRERLRHMIGQVREAELTASSLEDLAGRLGCSERHFSRLFREEFGVSFCQRQIELRLLRARQLLSNPDTKIIHVAYDSGYRHLGLFNSMFKKRFGITPSEWRRNAQKSITQASRSLSKRAGVIALLAGLCLGFAASAQTNPASAAPTPEFYLGTPASPEALRRASEALHRKIIESWAEERRSQAGAVPPPATNTPAFEVKGYDVTGNTVLPSGVIEVVLAPYTGPKVTFDAIRQALADLQMAYRDRGFVTVSVGLPPQKLTNGIVRMQVTEGRLAEINVLNNRFFSTGNVLRALPSLHTNILLNSHVLQRELDAANTDRDRQIYPRLGPGPDPGTSLLDLKVKDRLPLHARLELDNESTPNTPDLRVNLNAQYNNLWDLDHEVGIQYGFTPERMKLDTLNVATPFDQPLIANYSAFYRLPLADTESIQGQMDAAGPARFGYNEASHQFKMPPVSGRPELTFYASRSTVDTGIQLTSVTPVSTGNPLLQISKQDSGENLTLNEQLGTRLSLPLRSEEEGIQASLILGFDFKRFRQASFNTNNFFETETFTNSQGKFSTNHIVSSAQPARSTGVDYVPMNVELDVSDSDSWGSSSFNASLNFNLMPGFSQDPAFSETAYSTKARADYLVFDIGASREQKVYKEWTVSLSGNGQIANGPLISNEQFPLGGMSSVRGYHEGEDYGDSGWRVSIEPHTPYLNLGMFARDVNARANGDDPKSGPGGNSGAVAPLWLRASTFVDYGQAYLRDAPTGTADRTQLCGVGFGATVSEGDWLNGRITFAWPLFDSPTTKAGVMQIFFGVGVQF